MTGDDDTLWQELNAYVDGELPPGRAARLAQAIAADRGTARQAALLSRMKAGLADSVELPPSLLSLPEPQPARMPARRPLTATLAAAVAGLLVLGGASLWLLRVAPEAGAPAGLGAEAPLRGWLAEAVALHHALAVGRSPAPDASRVSATFPGLLPDLSAARLTPGPVRPADLPELGRGAAVQYLGRHGCRVSLVALEQIDGTLPEALQDIRQDEVEAYRWRVGAIGYLLVAEGMDPGRLRAIAETAYEATRRFRPPDAAGRARLADARRRAAPCRA
ncbi:Transmembrane transcriptional regulator (anti-sigma factor RsiW) [Tistlia consotensis]|uniref:Transmembrane transcriptional regulator (Anti-sigma factor RsiW) n=1 Tax=Tistlia consotensis USBA 355 TaxID=560819 RepID=A0A1Y6CUL8_9PROT|nr:hypothetical protein [Tistlia consotensis]SMF78245.1 Transmembrane transcriptional regulator (anti-sigma factor RsiW) [Tistlia consotensis USBA 355]SNS18132.1 Transmembrane transcriptional regulator (anti-sigma factor RsiW) [Tistlia consotensis]